jgi:hypothetical protein
MLARGACFAYPQKMNWLPFNTVMFGLISGGFVVGSIYELLKRNYLFAAIFIVIAMTSGSSFALRLFVMRHNRRIRARSAIRSPVTIDMHSLRPRRGQNRQPES